MTPIVAIVGRPNVGKSSLFNALAGKRISIVEPTAGVTRDRVASLVTHEGRAFELVDTGGIGIVDSDQLTAEVEKQIQTAIDQADILVFVVDARSGLVPLDEKVADQLRRKGKLVLTVANKCDTAKLDGQAAEFHGLGLDPLICVSAQEKRGTRELLDWLVERLPAREEKSAAAQAAIKIAIVGRRNVGKSTFINQLAQAERMIVSEIPGTTRDSVDIRFERDGKAFVAIDTAGVRRRKSIGSSVEFYSLARAERSIRRADAVLHFLDASQPISKVDKQLAGYVLEQYKPAIFVVNKWDLLRPMPTGKFGEYVRRTFPSLDFVPIAFMTAKTGRNVYATLNLAQNLVKQADQRVTTGDLNRVVEVAVAQRPPPLRQNRRPKIFYATQVAVHPPTIVLMTNSPELFSPTYQRYLLKIFRDKLPFNDIPIKLYLRRRTRTKKASPKLAAGKNGRSSSKGRKKQQESEVWKDV